MEIEKYTPNSLSVGAILGLIASGDIAMFISPKHENSARPESLRSDRSQIIISYWRTYAQIVSRKKYLKWIIPAMLNSWRSGV